MILDFTNGFNKKPSVILHITDGFVPSVITACYHRPTNIDGSETVCDDGSEPSVMRFSLVVIVFSNVLIYFLLITGTHVTLKSHKKIISSLNRTVSLFHK